jgi:hypothetical protein
MLRHAGVHPHPLINLAPMRIRTFSTSMLWGGLGIRIVVGSTPLLWPILFQVGFGMTPFQAGSLVLVCAVGDVATKGFTTQIIRRFGFRPVLVRAALLLFLGAGAFALFTPATPIWVIVLTLVWVGVVRSLSFTGLNTLGYADIPPAMMSSATSLASTIQQLSFGVGIAYGALVLHGIAAAHGRAPGAFTLADLHVAFVAIAAAALLAAWKFSQLPADAGAVVSGHAGAARLAPAAR